MKQKDFRILVGINKNTDQLHYIHATHLCLFFPSAESRISYDARLLSKRVMQDI